MKVVYSSHNRRKPEKGLILEHMTWQIASVLFGGSVLISILSWGNQSTFDGLMDKLMSISAMQTMVITISVAIFASFFINLKSKHRIIIEIVVAYLLISYALFTEAALKAGNIGVFPICALMTYLIIRSITNAIRRIKKNSFIRFWE